MLPKPANKYQADWDANRHELRLTLTGSLEIRTLAHLWQQLTDLQRQHQPSLLLIDAKDITYCDGAGTSLLLYLKHEQEKKHQRFALESLSDEIRPLFDTLDKISSATEKPVASRLNLIAQLGKKISGLGRDFYHTVVFLGSLTTELAQSILHPASIRWRNVWRAVEITGPNALPIILLLGFLLGLIISFQSAIPLAHFGAVIYIANLVGISLTRELAPLMVAIILAGRTASSFAAELGTMKVNQEIDALKTMGLSPLVFLVIPRLLAVMLMTPILTIFMTAVGLLGCFVFMMTAGYSWEVFYHQVNVAVTMGDLWGGLFKALVFGLLIAGIGCKNGLATLMGASAVGDSTTNAVVSSIITIVIVDGLFAVLFYMIGI